jgi:hypothetical protein
MFGINKTALYVVLFAAGGFLATPAFAGLLDTGTVYNGWKGSTTFSQGNLSGYIDYAVFGPGDFPFSDENDPAYTDIPSELTYVYQVFSEGSDHISQYWVKVDNTSDNIGFFSDSTNGVTGNPPNQAPELTVPGWAKWKFDGIYNTPGDNSSQGLAYSSLNTPVNCYSIVINGGAYTLAQPVPAPSNTPIPEPNVLLVLAIGLGVAIAAKRFWQR